MTSPPSLRPGVLQANQSLLAVLQRAADAVLIVGGHYIALQIYPHEWTTQSTVAVCIAVVVFHLFAELQGLYRPWRGAPLRNEIVRTALTWLAVLPVLLIAAFVTKKTEDYSRVIAVSWFGISAAGLSAWRVAVRSMLRELRRRGRNLRRVAIAGVTPMAQLLAQRIVGDPSMGLKLAGFYDDRGPGRRHPIPDSLGDLVGNLDEMLRDVKAGKLDIVYIALPLRAETRITSLVSRLSDSTANVYVVADLMMFDLLHARWTNVADVPVVSVFDTPFDDAAQIVKRIEDIVIGSMILAMIAIPMLFIAIGVKLSSPGPVFFRQRRYGLDGEEIQVLKFRSMTVCENGPVIVQAKKNDARVTRFGAFLRRTSLDELPQFINVLKGDMSIVGPRPHAVAHNEMYRGQIRGYMLRHKVKPGITGWAQVNGWRGETDTIEKMEKRVQHDLYYIRNWRLAWDLQIILLTIFGSKKNDNAY